jgi:lysyl-tRNA synthetase class 2
LARVRDDHPPVAERFELYLGAIELCNGYQELTDAEELARRMRSQDEKRVVAGAASLPVESRLVEAMRGDRLPDCSGVALGFDRLVMWRLGLERIDAVIPFPIDRA